jgi:DNA repair protein RadD
MKLRPYQQATLDALYQWWVAHPGIEQAPILVLPTGAGKSIVIAELVRLLFDTWPEDHPRTLVLVPSKELAEQNADKLVRILPSHISLGYYSASVGQKRPDADVIVATIGSIAKAAHLLGNIKCVMVDECFVGDTQISAPFGSKRIADIEVGDAIYTATGIGIVQVISSRIPDSIYAVRFSDGTEIRVTGNHPFFTSSGWKNAKDLARGDGVICLQDMCALWECLSALDERGRDWQGVQYAADKTVCQSKVLLNLLLEEIGKCDVGSWRKGEDVEHAEAYSAQAIANWWKRPWNDAFSISDAFDSTAWLGSGVRNQDRCTEVGADIPDMLQGGHRESRVKDCDRTGRCFSQREAQDSRQEKRRVPGFTWVESVSIEEPGSIEPVFNLQVSGHPSYFADGILVHNCHLTNPDGAGMYRRLLKDLAKYCDFRVVGLTATPFRGNGVWLTDGTDPLFTGIAYTVAMQTLFDSGHLAPLVRPADIQTRIDVSQVGIASTGDYQIDALAQAVEAYLEAAAAESVTLAAERKKWLAFTPTVANAQHFAAALNGHGVSASVVTGDTPKKERERLIAEFRAGHIRCLVTVLALATGFDVPDVDCIVWCRPTISPVLYVQGAGRGLRPAPGKTDCLWLDFSDTTERLGPIDAIKGRKKTAKRKDQAAPFTVCDACGAQVIPASAMFCPECGAQLREETRVFKGASDSAILSTQIAPKLVTYPVDNVTYAIHKKEGSPDSLRVEYWSGLRVVAREWVCFEHPGFAGEKARKWWAKRDSACWGIPHSTQDALFYAKGQAGKYAGIEEPTSITVNESGKYPDIIGYNWSEHDETRTSRQDPELQTRVAMA